MSNVFGIKSENEFICSSSVESLEALKMKLGIVPLKLLPHKRSSSRFGSQTSALDGSLPERKLLESRSNLIVDA